MEESSLSPYYGAYTVFGKFRTNKYLFAIGPHWYVSLLGIFLLTAVSALIFIPIWPLLNGLEHTVFFVLYGFMIFSYVITIFWNPGIIPMKQSPEVIDLEGNEEFQCSVCRIPKGKMKAVHCHDCKICIEELDHHCIWTGKCIGKGNLKVFYVFIGSVPVFFVYIMIISVIIGNRTVKSN